MLNTFHTETFSGHQETRHKNKTINKLKTLFWKQIKKMVFVLQEIAYNSKFQIVCCSNMTILPVDVLHMVY